MTNEELVLLYQQGDNKALEELIRNFKKIISWIVNKFKVELTSSIDIEDLKQEGYIGLINAANKYDFNNENKAQFSTYAIYHIDGRINSFVSKKNTSIEISLDKPIKDGEKSKNFLDNIASTKNSIEDIENNIYISDLRTELEQAMRDNNTLYERELLELRYGWDNCEIYTYDELGNIFNISSKQIYNNELRALRKLRNSEWGIEAEKKYFINKAEEIQESSKFNQDKSIEVMDIMNKYLGEVI